MNDYEIKELYEQMELELILSMKRNLKRHLKDEKDVGFKFTQWQAEKIKELKRYQSENKDIIGGYTSGLDKEVSKHLKSELKQGALSAINLHNRVSEDKVRADRLMNKSFFKTNDRKVNALIKSVNNDLKKANTGALRMINDQYRQVIHRSAFFAANGVMTEKQAIDMANKDFLARGLNCIEYKNGRRVNIASYAEMAVRTASLRAHLMGEGDFRKSIGRTLVQSTSHGGACPICQKWEKHIFIDDVYSGGKKEDGPYMLLSNAMDQGFLHPNCKHGLTTYYPELAELEREYEENNEYEEHRNEINYCDRNIKKYNRLMLGSLDSDNIQNYKQKKSSYEKMNKELVRESTISYEDITKEMITNINDKPKELGHIFEFIKKNEDGSEIIYNTSNAQFDKKALHPDELKTVDTLKNKLGWDIDSIHRINKPDGIKTPDIRVNGSEYWEIKNIYEAETEKSKKSKLIHRVTKQCNNFIFDISNEKCNLTNEEGIEQVKKIYNDSRYYHVNKIVLIGKEDFIKIYKRK